MGKHRAVRKPDVPMRLAMVSTAALLTALVTADRDSSQSGTPTATGNHTTVGEPSGPFSAPQPEALPDAPSDERPFVETAPPAEPEPGGRHRREDPPAPVDEPETPPHHDVLSGMTAAWVSGTTQGYEWLVHIEQCIVSHVMSNMEQRTV
ncbi:hypothetical protein ACQPW1_20250 [Nocardia sp. CA-128927]|uniref:hypothetical protein n=1 Tax=Nocardia sp. CA-128927 TaxID=3239975 RepID=UPI003D9527F2